MSNSSPSLTCETPDIYTTMDSSTGNKALTYPIGLISADEAMFVGIPWSGSNQNNYLYTGQSYWTMSPHRFSSGAGVFYVYSGGGLKYTDVDYPLGVRPVINIRADVELTGSGTTNDPFKLSVE